MARFLLSLLKKVHIITMEVSDMFSNIKYWAIATFLIVFSSAHAATIYVDQTLTSDCTNGTYSIAFRNCSGSDGDAYNTVQKGVNALRSGDTLYLRGGTYLIRNGIVLNPIANGTSWNNCTKIASSPGEWAVLDGQNNVKAWDPGCNHGAMIGRSAFSMGSAILSYWTFERLEFTRADCVDLNKSYALWIEGGPFKVRYCYFHDNGTAIDNPGHANSGCIVGHQWKDSIIEYCYFKNNRNPNTTYMTDIKCYSDYKSNPADVQPDSTTNWPEQNNTYRYNLFEGGGESISFKNGQFLSLDHSGKDMRYKDRGTKIHHNIVRNTQRRMQFWMDFVQVYNNIFDNCNVIITTDFTNTWRETFHSVVYNNLFKNTRFAISKGKHEGDTTSNLRNYLAPSDYPDYHPHCYIYNNIFEDISGAYAGLTNLGALFDYYNSSSYGPNMPTYTNYNTIHVERNLFYGSTTNTKTINIGQNSTYSVNEMESNGWSTLNYATISSGLHPYVNNGYKTAPNFSLGRAGKTIVNGGIGGNHPYLVGVTIPSYVGPCDPNDSTWIDRVLGLSNINNLRVGGGDSVPPNPPLGISVSVD